MSIMHVFTRRCYFCGEESIFQTNMVPYGPPLMLSTEPPPGWQVVGSVLCCPKHRSIKITVDDKEYVVR